jgi:uncharacterized protein YndB with AHSA1/START domain
MESSTDKVQLEILLSAPLEKVWKAWTQPDQIAKWFGSDPDGKVLKAILNVRPTGLFEITFMDSDQTEHTCFGVYSAVREFTNLEFSWNWKSEPGVESFVTVELKEENNFTRMLFPHEHLGKGSLHNYEEGWKATFLKLEQSLVKQ